MYLAILAILVVLVGVVVGRQDLARFRLRRVRAIAGVCFAESIRRRILWITPLAIVGVVAVSQFTRPQDEQDAIRQTIKYSLFAAGLIVIMTAVLLAATNLPREIENRVIYTIVTKPTTRLEIVAGKVLGFAAVSAMILLIMGLFTWGYARARSAYMVGRINAALAAGTADPNTARSLRHYASAGLLSTKSFDWPVDLEVFSRLPDPSGGTRWMAGGSNQYFAQTFALAEADRQALAAALSPTRQVLLLNALTVRQRPPTAQEEQDLEQSQHPTGQERAALVAGPELPTTGPAVKRPPLPQIAVGLFGPGHNPLAAEAASPTRNLPAAAIVPGGPAEPRTYPVALDVPALEALLGEKDPAHPDAPSVFVVEVAAVTPTVEYGADDRSTTLGVYEPVLAHAPRQPVPSAPQRLAAAGEFVLYSPADNQVPLGPVTLKLGEALGFAPAAELGMLTAVAGDRRITLPDGDYRWLAAVRTFAGTDPGRPGTPAAPRFLTRLARTGMQVRGQAPEEGEGALAVYRFDHAAVSPRADGKVSLQLRVTIERGGDLDAGQNASSRVAVRVRNRQTGKASDPVEYIPEPGRFSYVDFDADYFRGGDFDVALRGLTPGQWLGFQGPTATTPSAAVVTAQSSFEFNLFKSLSILWLLSVLVVVIAVFTSTFLSWPIAVVLTMLLLLGRWGVNELGDALEPGESRTVGTEVFGIKDPASLKAVTSGMTALSSGLKNIASVLPDVGKFPVIDDIDRGVSIPFARLGGAAGEAAWYGLPLLVLTYLILRNKEVAP